MKMVDVAANIARLQERIAAAARRSGRRPEEITLVAVTKTIPLERIQEAIKAGIRELGENRVQELLAKQPLISGANWHFIGHFTAQQSPARLWIR